MVLKGATFNRQQREEMHRGEPRCGGFLGIGDGRSYSTSLFAAPFTKPARGLSVSVELVTVIEHYFVAR